MINLSNVSFSYGTEKQSNLKNVSLNIKKGECVLLCGASGCGKTTITRLINGLIPHFYNGDLQGSINVCDWDTQKTDMATISDHVGSVFQNPRTQFFNTDTDSEIVFGLENRGVSKEELKATLANTIKELNMEHLQNRSIFELSGGEKQKIAFASVYATNPDVFVLDEPSSNLDKEAILSLSKLLKKVKAQGKTIVVAEHRIWYLLDIADRVVYMQDGEIIYDLSIDEFRMLTNGEVSEMGLRCRSLSDIGQDRCHVKTNTISLSIEQLSVTLGESEVLSNMNFSVNGGEVLGVIGANGTGKTTLARAICGLQKPSQGSITLQSKPLSDKERKRKSYMVMQDVNHQLFTESVEAECTLGIKEPDKEAVKKALELLDLTAFKERHPISLSGGQKQRLAVAVSLLCDKEIVVFDEPTSGLDLKSMQEVSVLIKMLSEQGKMVIVITHDYEFIAAVCTSVLMLNDSIDNKISLQGVEDTLFIPLMARAYVSKRFPEYFYDVKVLEIEKQLPSNFITEKSSEYMDCSLPTLFVVAGVFEYFKEQDVLKLIKKLQGEFQQAEMIFDAVNDFGLKYVNRYVQKTGNINAMMYFSVNEGTTFAALSNTELIKQHKIYAKVTKPLKKKLKLYTKISMFVNDYQENSMILELKL